MRTTHIGDDSDLDESVLDEFSDNTSALASSRPKRNLKMSSLGTEKELEKSLKAKDEEDQGINTPHKHDPMTQFYEEDL